MWLVRAVDVWGGAARGAAVDIVVGADVGSQFWMNVTDVCRGVQVQARHKSSGFKRANLSPIVFSCNSF